MPRWLIRLADLVADLGEKMMWPLSPKDRAKLEEKCRNPKP